MQLIRPIYIYVIFILMAHRHNSMKCFTVISEQVKTKKRLGKKVKVADLESLQSTGWSGLLRQ